MKYDFSIQAKKQKNLDKIILEKISIEEKSYWTKRIIALLVEISELSNEVRFFKYWSNKSQSSKEVILEEFVDVVHFVISIGNSLGVTSWKYEIISSDETLDDVYINLLNNILRLNNEKSIELFRTVMSNIIQYAFLLKYSMIDIEKAYEKKNKVNYERQKINF